MNRIRYIIHRYLIVVCRYGDGRQLNNRLDTKDGELKVRDTVKMIEADGWYQVATRGSHRHFKHPDKPARVTIAVEPSDDLAPGTLNSILKQASLRDREKDE